MRIAPDTDNTNTGGTFFRVVVETDRTWLGAEKGALPISPGMEATVDIKTGRRTVIDYLMRPILKLRSEAFRGLSISRSVSILVMLASFS